VVGERGKWSGGRRGAFSGPEPEQNVPPPSHRRKPADVFGAIRMPLVTSARGGRRGRRSEMSGVCSPTGTRAGHGDPNQNEL
jgi:hypothetical protein